MWRNLSRLTGFLSPQLPQLAVQDRPDGENPYLVSLADTESSHIAALGCFQRRICVTMVHGDIVIPAASGALWADRKWAKPAHPPSQVAGWGFEAYSCKDARTPSMFSSSANSESEAEVGNSFPIASPGS